MNHRPSNFYVFSVSLESWLERADEDVPIKIVAHMRKHLPVFNQWDRNVVEQAPSLQLVDYKIFPEMKLAESEKHDIEQQIFEAALNRISFV